MIDNDLADDKHYDLCSINKTKDWYKDAVSKGQFKCHESIKLPEGYREKFKNKTSFEITDFKKFLDQNSDCFKSKAYKDTTLFAQVSCGLKPEE